MTRPPSLFEEAFAAAAAAEVYAYQSDRDRGAAGQLPAKRTRRRRRAPPGEGGPAALSIASVLVLASLWWAATHLAWVPPLFLPTPEAVWAAFVDAWHGRVQGGLPLAQHLGWSTLRVFGAFLLAAALGVPTGILMGVNRVASALLDPPLEFYRPLPPLAYLPLVVIWFGIDETAKIVVIFLACYAPIVMSSRAGVRSATIEQVNAAISAVRGSAHGRFGFRRHHGQHQSRHLLAAGGFALRPARFRRIVPDGELRAGPLIRRLKIFAR